MNETSSLVRACLEMDEKSIHWSCELNPIEAFNFLAASKEYNGMNKLFLMVEKINKIIPTMEFGEENPNNNKSFHTYRIGNECSRVIYVDFSKSYLTKYRAEKWDEKQILRLISDIQSLGKRAGADEISVDNSEHSVSIRLWWLIEQCDEAIN